jgi:hypothetical protein
MTRWAFLAGLAAFWIALPLFHFARGYPWKLAFFISAAVAALVYSALRAAGNLQALRSDDESWFALGGDDSDDESRSR